MLEMDKVPAPRTTRVPSGSVLKKTLLKYFKRASSPNHSLEGPVRTAMVYAALIRTR